MADFNLKPCPFCGGPAELRSYTDASGKKSWNVRCQNMCVVTCQHRDDRGRWRPMLRREAIGTWNHRASEPATGHWQEICDPRCWPTVPTISQCSVCGKRFSLINLGYKFCPECGARMDKGDKTQNT